MLAGVKSTLAPAEIRRRRQQLKQAIEAFVQAMVNEAIGWSTANWLIQGLFTSLLSGLGFLFITLALEYIKQYSREQKKRERVRLIHAILNGEEFHDFDNASAIIPVEKGTVVRPGIRGLTSLFGAYKKYGGFLGIGRGFNANNQLAKVEEEDDDSDHQFKDRHSNTCLDAPTWSNLSLESWNKTQAVKCLPEQPESLQARSRPYLPHAVFSSAVPSNVRLWSQPSFENEESMSSMKTITKSEGDFFGRLIQKYPYVAPFFKKELFRKIEAKGKKNPEDEQAKKGFGIDKGKREKTSSDSTTRESNRRYKRGGVLKTGNKSEMTMGTCETDVDKSCGVSSSSSKKQRSVPRPLLPSQKLNAHTTSPQKCQKINNPPCVPTTLKASSVSLESQSKDIRKQSSENTCSNVIKKLDNFPAHIVKSLGLDKSTDPRSSDDATKSSTGPSSTDQSCFMVYLSPGKGKILINRNPSVDKNMRPIVVGCDHGNIRRASAHEAKVSRAPQDEPPSYTRNGEKFTTGEKFEGGLMKSLVDLTQAPSTIIGADNQTQSDIEVGIAKSNFKSHEIPDAKAPERLPSTDTKLDSFASYEMDKEEHWNKKTSPKRSRSMLAKQGSKKSHSQGGTGSLDRGKKESAKKRPTSSNEEGLKDVQTVSSESKNRRRSESKHRSSSDSKLRSNVELKGKSSSGRMNPIHSKSPKRGGKKSTNEDQTKVGYHLKNTKSNNLKKTPSHHDQHKMTKVTKLHRKNKSSSPPTQLRSTSERRRSAAKDKKTSSKTRTLQKAAKLKKPKNVEVIDKHEKLASQSQKSQKRAKSTAARDRAFSPPKLHKSLAKSSSEKVLSPVFNAEMYASSIHEVISAEDYDNAINQFLHGNSADRSFKQKHMRSPPDQKHMSPPKQGKGASVNTLWKRTNPPSAGISSSQTHCKPFKSVTPQRGSPASSSSQVMSQPTSCMTISRPPLKVPPIASKAKSPLSSGFADTSANSLLKKCMANDLIAVGATLPPKNREKKPAKPAEVRKSHKPDGQSPINRSISYNLLRMRSSDLPKASLKEERLQFSDTKKPDVEQHESSPQQKTIGEMLWNPKMSVSDTSSKIQDRLDGDMKYKTRKYPSEVLTLQQTMGDSDQDFDQVIKRQEPNRKLQQKCNLQKPRWDKNKLRMDNISIRSIESLKKYDACIQQTATENENKIKDLRFNGAIKNIIPSKVEQKKVSSGDHLNNVQASSSRTRQHVSGCITKSRKNVTDPASNNKRAGTVCSENSVKNIKKLVHQTLVSKSHDEQISEAGLLQKPVHRLVINHPHSAVCQEPDGTGGQLNPSHSHSKMRILSKSPLPNEQQSGQSMERFDQSLFKRRIIKWKIPNRSTTETRRTRAEEPRKIQAANSSMPELSEREKVDKIPVANAPKQRQHAEFPRMFDRFMAFNLINSQKTHEANDTEDKAIVTSNNSDEICRVVSENQSTVNGFESSTAFLSASEGILKIQEQCQEDKCVRNLRTSPSSSQCSYELMGSTTSQRMVVLKKSTLDDVVKDLQTQKNVKQN